MKEEKRDQVLELLEMCYYGHLDQVKNLIEGGIDVNTVGTDGYTSLKAAKEGENDTIVHYLVSLGAKE